MEAVDVQTTSTAGKKSPRLAAVARLLLQGDIGQSSSSSYDFQSCRQEQDSRTIPNTPGGSNTNGRQQHRAVEMGGQLPLTTRFEQQAEQLLQQDQALQMDQILDLLGLLLKQQQPPVEQQFTTTAADTSEAQRRLEAAPPLKSARRPADFATSHWVNTDKLSRGTPGMCDTQTDSAAARELLSRSRRESISSAMKCSNKYQQEKVLLNFCAEAETTVEDGLHNPNPPITIIDSKSGSPPYLEGKQYQKKQLAGGNPSEWSEKAPQPPSTGMACAGAAATGAGPAALRGTGGDSVCARSYNSNTSGSKGEQQRLQSGSPSPAGMSFRLGADVTDPLATSAEEGACFRDGRQLPQRLQLQHQLPHQQRYQPGQAERQQLQLLQHLRTQEYLMEQHDVHPQHLQPTYQSQASGQKQPQELHAQHSNPIDVQVQRGEVEEISSNEETSHILSKSLDVLMGDVNIQALKDLLMRKTPNPTVGSGSGTECRDAVETSYSSQTPATPGEATSFDAAILSLLQQQHQYRQEQPHAQQQSVPEGESLLNRNLPSDSKSEQHITQERKQYRRNGKEGETTPLGAPHAAVPPAASVTTRGRSCNARNAEEIRMTRTGQRHQEGLQGVSQGRLPQKQHSVQQQEAGTGSLTDDTACLAAPSEKLPSCHSLRSPAQKVKSEGLNFRRSGAAEGATATGASGNKRGVASHRQQQQQAEKKRGRFARSFSPKDNREYDRQYILNTRGSGDFGGGVTGHATLDSDNRGTEREGQEAYNKEERRRTRFCTSTAAREGCFVETSPSDDSPPSAELARASLLDKHMCTTGGATLTEAADREYGRGGQRSSGDERQEAFGVCLQHQQRAGTTASSGRLQEKRHGEIMWGGHNNIAEQPSEDILGTPAEKRVEAEDPSDVDKQPGATTSRTDQACEVASGTTGHLRARLCSTTRPYRSGRRRFQEPCELALAAARLEQQGHTFTPPFYLRTPAVGSSNGGSRCGSARGENGKRGEAAAGVEERRERNYHDGDTAIIGGGGARSGFIRGHSQSRTASHEAEEDQREVNLEEEEEEEDSESEVLTQQQLTLLKHIYAVLSQAEEYFSFKSALYQLQIKRHLKKCVSSLAAAAATHGTSSDKDSSPNTAAGGNKHHRSPVHANSSPSKAIRLFTSMPPIPINVVEQRALLSVRKHLQAGGGGALLCQGDGFAQLLMEELDELLTSLVNKLLLIIVVKFQTCFIHAPARAQLREFLVSFVFPGDMATQLLFRDHVQAVVHARIRHFRDSVGRTLRHQPPPSPPLAAAPLPRGGTKRSSRAAGGSTLSPTSRDTEEEGDDEEERQKKQKVCEVLPEVEERDSYSRGAAAPAGRSHSCSDRRRLPPAPGALTTTTQPNDSACETACHSTTSRAAMQPEKAQGKQNNTLNSNERKTSPASKSPKIKGPHRERFLSSSSDAKQVLHYATSGSVRGIAPGREGGRNSRAFEQGTVISAADAATASVSAGAQRKGSNGGAEAPAFTEGGETGTTSKTRGRLNSRRRRGTVAANNVAEVRSPNGGCSRYGPAAATRRGGNTPATDKNSNSCAYPQEGAAIHLQQCVRETGSTGRRGGVAAAAGAKSVVRGASEAFIPAHRNQRYARGSAREDQRPDDNNSNGQIPEGQRRERETHSEALADLQLGRTSAAIAQPYAVSQMGTAPRRQSALQQQQQRSCSPGKEGDIGRHWRSAIAAEGKAENCDKLHGSFGDVAEGSVDLMGSRNSILSRGSTRESAGDPLAWEQADTLHPKGFANQRGLSSSQVHVPTEKATCSDSLDAGGDEVKTLKGAAGEKTSSGDTPRWTTTRSGGDEATQALAAALGGAFDSSNCDSATAAAGDVWEWLAVAAGSKDEQQQEKFKQTLETLLNAWSTTESNDGRSLRGMQNSELTTNNCHSKLGPSNGSNNASGGWLNLARGIFPGTQEKKTCADQMEEANLDPFDIAGGLHFPSGGVRAKDASLVPSPSSVKGPPSEASTSLPPSEERTPPAERSTAASAEPDATHSLVTTGNGSSRRGSLVCLPDVSSLRTGSTTAGGERGNTVKRGTASAAGDTEGEVTGSLRISLPGEVNKTRETIFQKEAPAFDNISHSTIADLLLTYCKDDISAYEIAGQLRRRETATSASALASTSIAPGASHGGVQGADAYVESAMVEGKLMNAFTRTQAEQTTNNAANNIELPALLAEALSASHTGGNSLAFSLSSLLASSSPLPS